MPTRSLTNFLSLAVLLLAIGGTALGQTESIVYHFKGGSDGSQPLATLTADAAGQSLWHDCPRWRQHELRRAT